MRQLMIGVGNQHGIDASKRQMRVVRFSQDSIDVIFYAQDGPNPQDAQRKFLDVDGQDLSGPSD